jgi:hypothetical protein
VEGEAPNEDFVVLLVYRVRGKPAKGDVDVERVGHGVEADSEALRGEQPEFPVRAQEHRDAFEDVGEVVAHVLEGPRFEVGVHQQCVVAGSAEQLCHVRVLARVAVLTVRDLAVGARHQRLDAVIGGQIGAVRRAPTRQLAARVGIAVVQLGEADVRLCRTHALRNPLEVTLVRRGDGAEGCLLVRGPLGGKALTEALGAALHGARGGGACETRRVCRACARFV